MTCTRVCSLRLSASEDIDGGGGLNNQSGLDSPADSSRFATQNASPTNGKVTSSGRRTRSDAESGSAKSDWYAFRRSGPFRPSARYSTASSMSGFGSPNA